MSCSLVVRRLTALSAIFVVVVGQQGLHSDKNSTKTSENATSSLVEMLSSPWIHLRALFSDEGSDCLRSGGGKVPYFNSCVGCSIGSAQQCVLDMRRNVSFNVPPDCTLGKLGASVGNPGKNDDQTCCAVEGKRETYAYPDAFRCLKNIKCVDSHIYASLKKECDTLCPTWKSIWEDACDPSSFDGAMSLRPTSFPLIAALSLLLALGHHHLS